MPPKKRANIDRRAKQQSNVNSDDAGSSASGLKSDPSSSSKRQRKSDGTSGLASSTATKQTKGDSIQNAETLKMITWNVAGIRAWIKKNAHQILSNENPDIVTLQETKCAEIPGELLDMGYHCYLDTAEKSGHGGVMLLTKKKPLNISYGMDEKGKVDGRGRLIVAEYENFYLINAYVPNSGRGLVNLDKRKIWDDCFLGMIKRLDAIKPVIYIGDLNVAHHEIDLANPKTNHNKTAGFTDQECNDFSRLLDAGFLDVYRQLNPEKKGAYTFWSHMHNARDKNVGWRLDYFVVSERLFNRVRDCTILSDVKGSDHCPLTMHIAF